MSYLTCTVPCWGFVVASLLGILYLAFPAKQLDFRGKHVVITGGSQGIGKEVAREVASKGGKVTIIARRPEILAEAKQDLLTTTPSATIRIRALDLATSYEQVEKAFCDVVQEMGQEIDVLVNCAGTSILGTFDEVHLGTFERLMKINYLGTVYATRAVVPSMKKRKQGSIAFVSSQGGQCGIYGFSAYSPTKFALVGLAQALAMELKPFGIKITTSYPPDTDTPGFEVENLQKPEACRLISESSGLFKPSQVAHILVRDIENSKVSSVVGIDGWMLSMLTAGMGRCSNTADLLSQLLLLPLFRVIGLVTLYGFDKICFKCTKSERAKNKAD